MKKLYIGLLVAILTIFIGLLGFTLTKNATAPSLPKEYVDQGYGPSPSRLTDSNSTSDHSNRVTRTVARTNWQYSVDKDFEKLLQIRVSVPSERTSSPQSQSVLVIDGKGCNSITSYVTDTNEPAVKSERKINGKKYYLSEATSTLMACDGERASYDQQLIEEILRIFNSLETKD